MTERLKTMERCLWSAKNPGGKLLPGSHDLHEMRSMKTSENQGLEPAMANETLKNPGIIIIIFLAVGLALANIIPWLQSRQSNNQIGSKLQINSYTRMPLPPIRE